MSTDFPEDLVALQVAFLRAEARCGELSAALPKAVDLLDGTAEPAPEKEAELEQARAERLQIVEELRGHSWWGGVEDVQTAREGLRQAAKERLRG